MKFNTVVKHKCVSLQASKMFDLCAHICGLNLPTKYLRAVFYFLV